MSLVTGIHHVTAFAKKPAANVAFYRDLLGLRLVKRTVNFDDPGTYHLYFGDDRGSPGTLLTYFPNPHSARSSHGGEEIELTTLSVAPGTLSTWKETLKTRLVDARQETRFGRPSLRLTDSDGMLLAIEEGDAPSPLFIHRVALRVPRATETIDFLTRVMGFGPLAQEGQTHRLALNGGGSGREIDITHDPSAPRAPMGAGTVHHVAWRVPDDAVQKAAAEAIRSAGFAVTQVMDRQYFRSIYFRIPGGVIFEIATDGPGFAVDEPAESLGTELKLPPQYEARRSDIERVLEPI